MNTRCENKHCKYYFYGRCACQAYGKSLELSKYVRCKTYQGKIPTYTQAMTREDYREMQYELHRHDVS